MTKTNHLILGRLRNAAYMQFQTDFMGAVDEFTPEALKIAHLYSAFPQLYAKADLIFKKILKSRITEQMQEADKARDEVWRALVETNTTALKHFNPVARESAKRIKIVLDTYRNIDKKPMIEQTSLTTNVLQDLEGKYLTDATAVGLLPWMVELKARNIAFANLASDRIDEDSQRVDMALKKARTELDKVYYEIIELINALVVVEGSANYEPFIRKLNSIIAKYNRLVQTSKRGKKYKPKEAEDTEDTQTNGGSDENT